MHDYSDKKDKVSDNKDQSISKDKNEGHHRLI